MSRIELRKTGKTESRETRCFMPIEMRVETVDNKKKIIGYAAVFNLLSEDLGGWKERISPGAFAETIKEDDIRALIDHESGRILGRNRAGTLKLAEDDKGLLVEITPPDTNAGRDVLVSIERGDVTGMSFGFRTLTDEWNMEDGVQIRTLVKVKLFDVSPVTFPAYPDTTVGVRSLEQWKEKQQPDRNRLMKLKLAECE